MALNKDQKKKMEQFLRETPNRVSGYGKGGGRRSILTDDLLGTIENILNTGVLQKYVYTQLNILPNTWEGWKIKGRESIDQLNDEENPVSWDDLTPDRQRMCYLVSVIESSKSKCVTRTWRNMEELSKTNYKAGEFILRTLGGKDFEHGDHYYHHGIGKGSEDDEEIKQELAGFLPKTIEQLQEDEA